MASEPLMSRLRLPYPSRTCSAANCTYVTGKNIRRFAPRLDHLGDDHDYPTSRRFGPQFPLRRPTNAPHIRRQAGTSAACVGSSRKYLPRYEELRSRPLHALPRRRGRRSKSPVLMALWCSGTLSTFTSRPVHRSATGCAAVETSGRTSSRVVPLNPFSELCPLHCAVARSQ